MFQLLEYLTIEQFFDCLDYCLERDPDGAVEKHYWKIEYKTDDLGATCIVWFRVENEYTWHECNGLLLAYVLGFFTHLGRAPRPTTVENQKV